MEDSVPANSLSYGSEILSSFLHVLHRSFGPHSLYLPSFFNSVLVLGYGPEVREGRLDVGQLELFVWRKRRGRGRTFYFFDMRNKDLRYRWVLGLRYELCFFPRF